MNKGEKDHELMIGRDVMMMDGASNGFQHDFFEGNEPMVMAVESMGEVEGDMMDEGMEHSEEEMEDDMDHAGFMVMMPHGSEKTTVTFTVTKDIVGEWEIGCFEDEGQHYDDGMKGTLVVKSS